MGKMRKSETHTSHTLEGARSGRDSIGVGDFGVALKIYSAIHPILQRPAEFIREPSQARCHLFSFPIHDSNNNNSDTDTEINARLAGLERWKRIVEEFQQ